MQIINMKILHVNLKAYVKNIKYTINNKTIKNVL